MKYEFFFLKLSKKSRPKVLRAIAPNAAQARCMIARRYGLDLLASPRSAKQNLDSLRIYEVDVENVLVSDPSREALRR